MANEMYDGGLNRFAQGQLDWVNHDIRCVLVDAAQYTPDVAAHTFLASVAVGARIATANLTGRTVTGGGICDAADATFASVSASSPNAELVLIYRFVTGDADSPLIAKIDNAVGLPVQPNGGNLVVQWSDTTNRIFRL